MVNNQTIVCVYVCVTPSELSKREKLDVLMTTLLFLSL